MEGTIYGIIRRAGERVVRGGEQGRERRGVEEDISREEIKSVLRRMRDGKAAGMDGIPGEAWRYGGEDMERWIWMFCNRVWRGEGWPESWKDGIIVPIVKKGEGKSVGHYRGVTLMPRVYTMVLAERLREEMEGKRIVPQNQTGVRNRLSHFLYLRFDLHFL